jgi:hypothetical protein
MESIESTDHVAAFTRELLCAGDMLFSVMADLVELLPPDSYPGEEPAEVVLDMAIGTIRTALESADRQTVEDATELISAACDRVLEHLELALELSRRMHGEADGKSGRA